MQPAAKKNVKVSFDSADEVVEAERASTMSLAITNVTQTEPKAETTPAAPVAKPATTNPQAAPAKPAATTISTPAATVQISSAAQALVQEALETQTQTLQEAAKGDPQAVRRLAKEATAGKTA